MLIAFPPYNTLLPIIVSVFRAPRKIAVENLLNEEAAYRI